MRKSLDLDQMVSATQVPTGSASERSMNRRYRERANAREEALTKMVTVAEGSRTSMRLSTSPP